LDLADALALDRQSFAVWPCLSEVPLGEWVLRFAAGIYGRSNSVQPVGHPGMDLLKACGLCEDIYDNAKLDTRFRLPLLGHWQVLDDLLATRGYELRDPTLVQIRPLALNEAEKDVELEAELTPRWIATYLDTGGRFSESDAEVVRQLLHRIPAPKRYASIKVKDIIVALGIGAVHKETTWLFGVATEPAFRGRGYGRAICERLLAWGASEGASRSALQVGAANEPALRLYENLGFETFFAYHYRVRPLPEA